MFFGRTIRPDSPFVYSSDNVDQSVGDVLNICNIALAPSSKENVTVIVKHNEEQIVLVELTKAKPHISTNFFVDITEHAEFMVKGKGEVHLIGFFEPEHKMDHLDEVELLHKHQHEHNLEALHHHQDHKKLEKETKEEKKPKQVIKEPKLVNLKESQLKEGVNLDTKMKEVQKPTKSAEEQKQKSDEEDEEESEDEDEDMDISEGSSIKGLEDLDDDIGEIKPTKMKNGKIPQQQKSKPKQKSQNKNQGQIEPSQQKTARPADDVKPNAFENKGQKIERNIAESKKEKKKNKKKNKQKNMHD